jgi:hypothetical protein
VHSQWATAGCRPAVARSLIDYELASLFLFLFAILAFYFILFLCYEDGPRSILGE